MKVSVSVSNNSTLEDILTDLKLVAAKEKITPFYNMADEMDIKLQIPHTTKLLPKMV